MSLTLYSSLINLTVKVFVVYTFIDVIGFDAVAWGTIIGWIFMNTYGYLTYRYYKKHTWADVYIYPSKKQVEEYKKEHNM